MAGRVDGVGVRIFIIRRGAQRWQVLGVLAGVNLVLDTCPAPNCRNPKASEVIPVQIVGARGSIGRARTVSIMGMARALNTSTIQIAVMGRDRIMGMARNDKFFNRHAKCDQEATRRGSQRYNANNANNAKSKSCKVPGAIKYSER